MMKRWPVGLDGPELEPELELELEPGLLDGCCCCSGCPMSLRQAGLEVEVGASGRGKKKMRAVILVAAWWAPAACGLCDKQPWNASYPSSLHTTRPDLADGL